MSSFDWYISPADKFSYETLFAKYSPDESFVTLQDLDPIFHDSRLSTSEFLQIWQLIDLKYEHEINKTQFIYLMHVVNSRRRGKVIPVGLPLNIKEEFLSAEKEKVPSRVFVRTDTNVRDVGASHKKSTQELESELAQLSLDLSATERSLSSTKERLQELSVAEEEVGAIVQYKKDHASALEKEVRELQNLSGKSLNSSIDKIDFGRARQLLAALQNDYVTLEQRASQTESELRAVKSQS